MSIASEKERLFQIYKKEKNEKSKRKSEVLNRIKSDTKREKKKGSIINGVKYNKNGYKLDADGTLLHRIISTLKDGEIPKDWHVHHCDFNKENNSIDNLVQIPEKLHVEIHKNGAMIKKEDVIKIRVRFVEEINKQRIKVIKEEILRLTNEMNNIILKIKK